MHLKRQEAPRRWPVPRKGSVYIVRPNSNLNNGIPILVVLRDMLKIAQNRKEVKRAIHLRQILVNEKPVTDDKRAVSLFDTITIVPTKKHYVIELSKNRKFEAKESPHSGTKVAKIINKKMLKQKKVQLNLNDGSNVLSDKDYKINDSIVINLKDKKIEKHIPLKEKANVLVFDGKHAGESGRIEKMNPEHKMAEIIVDGKTVSVLIKQIMAI